MEEEYDEFGNFVGAEHGSESSDSGSESPEPGSEARDAALVPSAPQAEFVVVDPAQEPEDKPVIERHVENRLHIEAPPQAQSYTIDLMQTLPERRRNVAVVGALHTGKTSVVDLMVREVDPSAEQRYTDTHKMEVARGVSIFAQPVALCMPDERKKSHIVTAVDCPGHPDFQEEVLALLRVCDGAVLVLDLLEGLTRRDRRILNLILQHNLPFVVVLNKIDRLIMELRLPVADCHLKIKHTLADVNAAVHHSEWAHQYSHPALVSPLAGNVVFAALTLHTYFTLDTFGRFYGKRGNALWGERFESHVLEPLYKVVTHTLASNPGDGLAALLWKNFGVQLHKKMYKEDSRVLLQAVFEAVFPGCGDLVGCIASCVPAPKTEEGLLLAEVFKMSLTPDASGFLCAVKVHRGTLETGTEVSVSGKKATVSQIYLPGGRYNTSLNAADSGSLVLVLGIDAHIEKTATISASPTEKIHLDCGTTSVLKVALEPEHPKELPRMVDGLRRLSKCYMSAVVRLEESGEHVLLGPGELYLDCVLHDLRYAFGEYLLIKVSDPLARFSETCAERLVTKITVAAKEALLALTAEPLDRKLGRAIETGALSLRQPVKTTAKVLRSDFGWDALAARSVWSFGPPGMQAPSVLVDDTLELETDKTAVLAARDLICAGFELGIGEGPLCEEPVRNVKFKMLDCAVSPSGLAQTVPVARNAVHTSLLTAAPRLMEPVYRVSVVCTYKCLGAVQTLLDKRRGWTVALHAVPATPLYEMEGYVPVMDSAGLDTDMRLRTQGQAVCFLEFCRWDIVPGDPLDSESAVAPMQPAPRELLARDFVMKTRKRKGLSGEPNLQKYIDPALFAQLRESGVV